MKLFYKLIQGDCLKVLPKLPTYSIDLVVTDPPYGFGRFKHDDNFCITLTKWAFVEIKRILKPHHHAFVFVPKNERLPKFISAIPLKFVQLLWLYKPNDETFPRGRWLQTSEAILHFVNQSWKEEFLNKEKYVHDCYVHRNVGNEGVEGHPTVKPLSVVKDLVSSCFEGDVVLDPFLGSGTTMLACQELRRSCIGIEINPKYIEIVKKRCFGRQFLSHEVEYSFDVYPKKEPEENEV